MTCGGPRLLEQNVRVFLQARSKVNRGIRDTLIHDPEMFFAYNNGITATAQAVDIRHDRGSLLLQRMTNFQIVNGGQTTASIHSAMRKARDLSQTYVQMKLSVVDSDRATVIVPKISEYANSQNRVMASDFFANHPFHIRVENFSRKAVRAIAGRDFSGEQVVLRTGAGSVRGCPRLQDHGSTQKIRYRVSA